MALMGYDFSSNKNYLVLMIYVKIKIKQLIEYRAENRITQAKNK